MTGCLVRGKLVRQLLRILSLDDIASTDKDFDLRRHSRMYVFCLLAPYFLMNLLRTLPRKYSNTLSESPSTHFSSYTYPVASFLNVSSFSFRIRSYTTASRTPGDPHLTLPLPCKVFSWHSHTDDSWGRDPTTSSTSSSEFLTSFRKILV